MASSSRGGRRAERDRNQVENVPLTEKSYKMNKEKFDQRGGSIPLAELEEMMKGDTQSLQLLRAADVDRDGALSYPEFMKIMRQGTENVSKFQKVLQTAVLMVVPEKKKSEDILEHYTCLPPPLFMITISIVELVIFIVYAVLLKKKGIETSLRSGAPLSSPLTYNPYRRYEAWRFLSYMFIHDGILHIISNLILQLVIGLPLELFHKFWRVGLVYSSGVIAGSLVTSVFDPNTFLVGASGGCYALIGAHFATIILNWKDMTKDWLEGPIKFILSAPVQLAFWSLYAGLDIAYSIYSRYNNPNRTAYSAHFAGLLTGILLGIVVLRNIQELSWEKVVWWVSLSTFLILILFALFWNGFYPHFPPTDWRSCCPDVR